MPLQVFEFHADSTVSLASPAAINRKSCDHCFLNRKTCDKVRLADDSGEKCKRCAKDSRPCTFTPTVHLYHIADCVGRHQCRAKVIQAMGGRKKEVQYKTIEIPIVCNMDSAIDQALFDFIQKQPNLLVYNNRIKSFLAQDMLGISADHDDTSPVFDQYNPSALDYAISPSTSPSNGSKRSFVNDIQSYGGNGIMDNSMTSPVQGPTKYRVVSPVDPQYQQQQQQQVYRGNTYANHQRNKSDDRLPSLTRPTYSPQAHPAQNYHASRHPSLPNSEGMAGFGQLSPLSSPNSLLPIDATSSASYDQRSYSDGVTATTAAIVSATTMGPYGRIFQPQPQQTHQFQQVQQSFQSQQSQHPYAQQSPYPQASFFQSQPQAQQMNSYRTTSPFPPSPLAPSPLQGSPQPPSPLDLALTINTHFGAMGGNSSHQNLPSLFDTSLTMGQSHPQHSHLPHQQPQHRHQQGFHRRQLSTASTRSSISSLGSPATSSTNQVGTDTPMVNPAPLVITAMNADGHEVGLYYAVPTVNLNPSLSDADIFQDFTMMDAVGENFVWIKNVFEEDDTSASDNAETAAATTSAIPTPITATNGSGTATGEQTMDGLATQHHQQQQQRHQMDDQWSSQYTLQNSFDIGQDGTGGTSQG